MSTNNALSPLHILLVEDNEHDRRAFRRAFRKSEVPVELTECVRAEEAMERLRIDISPFDLVVADHNLPGMSGLKFCEELIDREIPLPLVLLTGGGSEHLAVEALKAGVHDYLIKDPDRGYLDLLPVVLPEVVRQYHDRLVRKQAEEALAAERSLLAERVKERTAELSKANAELSRAVRLKDEFLAIMSHELRTPLNVILGMAEVLLEEIYGVLNDKQLEALRHIEESGRHLFALINDILDLSGISAGRLELDKTPVSVEAVCQASLRLFNQAIRKKNLKVSSMFDCTITTILADECRLKQALMHLLSNAVKFTPERGRIGLDVEAESENQVVHFTVWDTGIGIAKEDMEDLFLPFKQVDSRLSRRYEGAGLGLSLVYHIVDMHDGSISVESEVNKGSRFTVSLPWQELGDREMGSLGDEETGSLGDREIADRTPPPSPSLPLPLSPPLHLPTILIVDDHETTITTLSEYLAANGYQLTVARNGKEALERIEENCPDLVLMDIQMPEMNGLEAIRCIRESKETMSLPVIAISALVMPGDREKCLTAGADDYICKPLNLKNLLKIIDRFLEESDGHE
jgi:signal transduction histidine kinase